MPHHPRDYFILWVLFLMCSATVVVAKVAFILFRMSPDPPQDDILLSHWVRRRRWITWSEFAALPFFATLSVALVVYYELNPIAGVLIAMALGGIGFMLLLDGVQWVFRKRLGLPADLGVKDV